MFHSHKTKLIHFFLAVFIAGSLSISPLSFQESGETAVKISTAQAQEAGDVVFNPSDLEWKTSIPNNFIRITKDGRTADGKPVVLAPSFTLNKAGSIGKVGFDTESPGYYIDSWGSDKYYVEELRVVAVNSKYMSFACKDVASDDCDEQYESPSDFFEERTLNVGQSAPFYLVLTPSDLAGLQLDSSASGAINNISVFPRMTLSLEFYDQDFPQAEAKFTIQVYDTLKQLQAASSTPPPPEAGGGGSEGVGSGQDNNRLKTCFNSGVDTLFCILNLVLGAIGSVLELVVEAIWSQIIAPGLSILLGIRTYTDDFANVIYPAWIILRNLTNIAFILAIVAMGIATVFRISGWAVRDLLIKLIVGAFLVNFSLVIPQAILGVAETVQNQFISADSGAINSIAAPLLTFNLFTTGPQNLSFGSFSETVRIFMNLWLILFAFVAFCGVFFLVVIRLIVLWVLLLSSPLIYAAYIFPSTKSFFNKWWSTFMKWAFITPVMAFMLNLTAIISSQNQNILVGLSGVDTATLNTGSQVIYVFMNNLIPIVFLYATVKVATSFGSGTSEFVDKALTKGVALGTGAGAAMLTYGAIKPISAPIKASGVWAKDRAQLGYLKGLNKVLAPSENAHEKWYRRAGAKLKGSAFNVLSGGALTAANQAARKREIDTKKMEMSGIAQDYRLVANKRKPQMQQGVLTAEYEKKLEERAREFSEQNRQETLDNIDTLLKKRKLSDDEMVDLEAYIKKSLKNDFSFGDVVNHDPARGKYRNITDMWRDLQGKTSDAALSRAVSNVNSIAVDKDKLHLVADVDNPHDLGDQNTKINKILSSKTASEIGQMNEDVFVDHTGALKGVAGDVRQEAFGKYIARFLNPANAQKLGNDITADQKKSYRRISVPELNRILAIAGLAEADIDTARDNFLTEIRT